MKKGMAPGPTSQSLPMVLSGHEDRSYPPTSRREIKVLFAYFFFQEKVRPVGTPVTARDLGGERGSKRNESRFRFDLRFPNRKAGNERVRARTRNSHKSVHNIMTILIFSAKECAKARKEALC